MFPESMPWENLKMFMKTYGKCGWTVLMIALLGMITGPATGAVITAEKDVGDFVAAGGHVEDGSVLPSSSDWGAAYGTMTTNGSELHYSTIAAGAAAYLADTDTGEVWALPNIDCTNGWTAETRIRVNSVAGDANTGAFVLHATSYPTDKDNGQLNLVADGVIAFGHPASPRYGYGQSNLGDFHTFRIAQQPDVDGKGIYSIYRDGVLLVENSSGNYYGSSFADRIFFGDASGNVGGDVDIDYVGLTPGAYAPVGFADASPKAGNLAKKHSSTFDWKYECAALPSSQDLDFDFFNDFEVPFGTITPTLSGNGTVLFETGSTAGDQSYFDGGQAYTHALWDTQNYNVTDDGYTIEFRAKVTGSINADVGLLSVVVDQDGGDVDPAAIVLDIAENKTTTRVEKGSGTGINVDLDLNANNDGFHVFRFVASPWVDNGHYFIYRDGELITEVGGIARGRNEVTPDMLYFGDTSGANSGTIELDYIRFMEGAYAPELIPGDTDNDGDVDADDLAVVAAHWGGTVGANDYTVGNFNGDTVVDAADAAIQAANWTGSGGEEGATGVPEPGTLAMLLGLLSVLLVARRRR